MTVKFNVMALSYEDGKVNVQVNTVIDASVAGVKVTCYSNGKLENMIFSAIDKMVE